MKWTVTRHIGQYFQVGAKGSGCLGRGTGSFLEDGSFLGVTSWSSRTPERFPRSRSEMARDSGPVRH